MKKYKTLSPVGRECIVYYLETDAESQWAVRQIRDIALVDEIIGLDIETAKIGKENPKDAPQPGLDPRLSKIRLVQFCIKDEIWVFDLFKVNFETLRDLLRSYSFAAHYGQFERGHLYHLYKEHFNIDCTMVMEQYIDKAEISKFSKEKGVSDDDEDEEFRPFQGYSLFVLCEKYFNYQMDKFYQDSDWGGDLVPEQIIYAALDAIAAFYLYPILTKILEQHEMIRAWKVTRAAAKIVCEIQYTGFKLDTEAHKKLMDHWAVEKAALNDEVQQHFGLTNLNSSKQLGKWLESVANANTLAAWPRTKKGAYSFGAKALVDFIQAPPIAVLLKAKKFNKLISAFGESLLEKVHPITNRIHSSYDEAGTFTGRMSCSKPNLQQSPHTKEFRSIFIAEKGNKLVIGDLSQIEVRVQAEISRDPNQLKVYTEGLDIYRYMASLVLNKPIEEVTEQERDVFKQVILSLSYGMGAPKLRTNIQLGTGIKISEEQAYGYWNAYHKKMVPRYSQWCNEERERAKRLGYSRTILGKKRKFSESEIFTGSPNQVIQGTAAEVLKAGKVFTWAAVNKDGKCRGKFILTMHDELAIECKEREAEYCARAMEEGMTKGFTYLFPNGITRGLIKAKICDSWADKK